MGWRAQNPINNQDKEQNHLCSWQPAIHIKNIEQHLICNKLVNILVSMDNSFYSLAMISFLLARCPPGFGGEALCVCRWIQLSVSHYQTSFHKILQSFFTWRMLEQVAQRICGYPIPESFKARLERSLRHRWKVYLPVAAVRELNDLQSPYQPKPSYIIYHMP